MAILMMVKTMAMKLTGGHLTEPLDEYEHLQPNARRLHRHEISRYCTSFWTPSFLFFLRLFQNFYLSGSCTNCLLQRQLIQTGRSILFYWPSLAQCTGHKVLIESKFKSWSNLSSIFSNFCSAPSKLDALAHWDHFSQICLIMNMFFSALSPSLWICLKR